MVSFNEVPVQTLEPFVYIEVDPSQASPAAGIQPYKALLIGQRTSAGTAAELEPTVVTSAAQAGQAFGRGSHAHLMARAFFRTNQQTQLTVCALDDDGGATARELEITISGTATAGGTLVAYIAGQRIQVGVSSGDAAAAVAAALDAAITAAPDLPFDSSVASAVVTITAKNAGTVANELDVRFNRNTGEAFPAGISAAVAETVAGATDPDITDVWAVLGEVHYNVWAVSLRDATNLAALAAELDDRYGPIRQLDALAIVGRQDSFGNAIAFPPTLNDHSVVALPFTSSPSPEFEWAAAAAGNVARYGQDDPARPFTSLELTGILAPDATDRFELTEREQLLEAGASTYVVDTTGAVRISRLVTTNTLDDGGAPTIAYRSINTKLTLSFMRWDLRTRIAQRFARHKLASDGNAFGAGQKIVTPSIMKSEVCAIAAGWVEQGLMENLDQFRAGVVVEINPANSNRIDVLLPPDLVNQFLVGAFQFQFRGV